MKEVKLNEKGKIYNMYHIQESFEKIDAWGCGKRGLNTSKIIELALNQCFCPVFIVGIIEETMAVQRYARKIKKKIMEKQTAEFQLKAEQRLRRIIKAESLLESVNLLEKEPQKCTKTTQTSLPQPKLSPEPLTGSEITAQQQIWEPSRP